MEAYIYSSTFKEFTRARRIVPWLIIAVLAGLMGFGWGYLTPGASADDRYTYVAFTLVFRILALSSAIFTTAVVGQEVEQRTIIYMLTRPIPRWKLLIFRYLASVTVVAIISILTAIFASIGVNGLSGVGSPLLWRDIGAIILGSFAYGGLFLLVSLVLNRAMIFCLLFAFGWETAVPNMPGEMYNMAILSHLQAVAQHPENSGQKFLGLLTSQLANNVLTAAKSIPILIILTIVCVAAAWWKFKEMEFAPKEDAE